MRSSYSVGFVLAAPEDKRCADDQHHFVIACQQQMPQIACRHQTDPHALNAAALRKTKKYFKTTSYRLLAASADYIDHLGQLVCAAEQRAEACRVVQGPP